MYFCRGRGDLVMSFAEQVAALRAFFGSPENVPLPLAYAGQNA